MDFVSLSQSRSRISSQKGRTAGDVTGSIAEEDDDDDSLGGGLGRVAPKKPTSSKNSKDDQHNTKKLKESFRQSQNKLSLKDLL